MMTKKKIMAKLEFLKHAQSFHAGIVVSALFLKKESQELRESIDIDTDVETRTKKINCANVLRSRAFVLEVIGEEVKNKVTSLMDSDNFDNVDMNIDEVIARAQESVRGSEEE